MKNQRTILLLGCMTTGIVMVLFVIDFMAPGRGSGMASGLVEKGRMSLFGAKTSGVERLSKREEPDGIGVLKERLNLVNRKLDRVIEVVEGLRASSEASSAVTRADGAGSRGVYRDPSKYSYRLVERPSARPRAVAGHPQYLDGKAHGPQASDFTSPSGTGTNAFRPRYSTAPESTTGPRKDTPVPLGPLPGSGLKDGAGNTVPSSESLEKLIGEFLNESLTTLKPPVAGDEGSRPLLDKALGDRKDLKSVEERHGLGGRDSPVPQKTSSTVKRGDTAGSGADKEGKAPSLDLGRRSKQMVVKEVSALVSTSQKPSDPAQFSRPEAGRPVEAPKSSPLRPSGGSKVSAGLYPSESEMSYDDISSSGPEEDGRPVGAPARGPRISLIKL